jgi:hypothetical protein
MAKISLPGIADDAIIDLQVSGYFHGRLVALLTANAQTRPAEDLAPMFERLKEDNAPQDLFEFNMSMILSLIVDIEAAAKAQGKVTEREFETNEAIES